MLVTLSHYHFSIFLVAPKRYAIVRIGAYLNVFHEGDNYKWERRNSEYGRINTTTKVSFLKGRVLVDYSPYYLLSFSCSIISIVMLFINSNYNSQYTAVVATGISLFTVSVFVLFYMNTLNYRKDKNDIINNWELIKKAEDKKAEQAKIALEPRNKTINDNLSNEVDTLLIRTFLEMALIIAKNSKTKEEAETAISNLTIFKNSDSARVERK